MKKAAILDYKTDSVCIEPIPDNLEGDVEEYLDDLGYDISNISWVCFEDEVPVYYADEQEPVCVL